MSNNVFGTTSPGTAVEGARDQYADGKAAKLWENLIGDKNLRTQNYKDFMLSLLRKKVCRRILDVACGTGVDSVMLLEEGFDVVSTDGSDKMLKYALQTRWNRRKEEAFDKWIIKEANWLTLYDDIEHLVGDGFDAVICLGNSFAHLLDSYGDQREIKQALMNFKKCIKKGGFLFIDHRNYDNIISSGSTSSKSIYYNSTFLPEIKTSVVYSEGKARLVILDYLIDTTSSFGKKDQISRDNTCDFRLFYYPHRLQEFNEMLLSIFGEKSKHQIFGDFKKLNKIDCPKFYIHYIEKQ